MFNLKFIIYLIYLHNYLTKCNIGAIINNSSDNLESSTIEADPNFSITNLTCEEFCAASHSTRRNLKALHADLNLNDPIQKAIDDWMQVQKRSRNSMNEEYLKDSSIIFGLSKTANENYISQQCYQRLQELKEAILHKDVWAMKALDSSGTKKSGFLWGNNYWLGSKQGCEAVQNRVYITLSKQYERTMKMELIGNLAPFQMEYRVLHVKHNSPWQVEIKCMTERIIHIGLCIPKVCSNAEIYNITQTYFNQGAFQESNIYDLDPQIINIKDLTITQNFINKKSLKIVGGFLAFTIIMLICAGCLSDTLKERKKQTRTLHDEDDDEIEPACVTNTKKRDLSPFRRVTEKSSLLKFIKCFDLVDNAKALFTFKEQTATAIPVINGLRSVSCVWIILFHVVWYMYFTVENKTFLVSYGEKIFFQYVSTAPLLVDVFFTISGFLVTYNFMKNEEQLKSIAENSFKKNSKVFGKMVLHRYLRLAPLYLVVTGMVEIFTAYSEDVSIFHIHERYDQTCSKYWWRNLFFIQNFFHHEDLCLNWTWSLACEMQFFCAASLLMFLYIKHPQKAKVIFFIGLFSSILWTYISGFRSQYQLSFDVVYNTGTQIYINPFVRIMPYFLGVGTGWFLATTKGQFEISNTSEKCYWNLAIVLFFACIYSTIKRDMDFFSTMSLLVIGRLSFSAAVCWMIVGSATGRSVWWSRVLECKIFQHFNKLSYAIYLLNPFIIAVVFSSSNTSTHADPILLCVLTSGFVVIVYIFSIIFSLSFEIPYCNLSSQLLRKKSKST